MKERDISQLLAIREGGTCEVATPVGYIDVLTPKMLYEVKHVRYWKAALGQVLSYAVYYPDHTAALYLYGESSAALRKTIKEHCKHHHINIVWHKEAAEDRVTIESIQKEKTKQAIKKLLPLSLVIEIYDRREQKREKHTIHLFSEQYPLDRILLKTYIDEAYQIFDSLLSNEITITLQQVANDEVITIQRHRPDVDSVSIYHQLQLRLITAKSRQCTVIIPGMRRIMASGYEIDLGQDCAGSSRIPEMSRLFDLILHRPIKWAHSSGAPITGILKAKRWKKV